MLPLDETSHLEQPSAPVRPDHFLNTLEQLLKAQINNGKKPGSHHFLTFLDYFLTICTVWLKRSLSAVMLLMWSMSLCLREKNRSSWALRERQDITLDLYRSFSLFTTEKIKIKIKVKTSSVPLYGHFYWLVCKLQLVSRIYTLDTESLIFSGGQNY